MNLEEENNPLPEEARSALGRSGDRLLAQLEAMREEESSSIQIEPLDPQAEIALRRHGEKLLSELADQRPPAEAQPVEAVETAKRFFGLPRWIGVAAALAILAVAAKVAIMPPQGNPAPPVANEADNQAPEIQQPGPPNQAMNPAVPEPSSALLTMVGGAWLLCRRRRN